MLLTATWYEKNDLNTSDMHPFIHPLSAAVDPAWEARSDWEIYKGFAKKFSAMRATMRDRHVEKRENSAVLKQAGLSAAQIEDMYRTMAIANYEDRFVIPTAHREYAENAYELRGSCGFSFGNGCSDGESGASRFGGRKTIPIKVTL